MKIGSESTAEAKVDILMNRRNKDSVNLNKEQKRTNELSHGTYNNENFLRQW